MKGLRQHPLRKVLNDEVHARPYGLLRIPARISHLAMVSGEKGAEAERDHVAALCRDHDAPGPAEGANHYSGDLGPFRLKWERHTEFCTYTFIGEGPFAHPFDDPVIDLVPRAWLDGIPGDMLVASHLACEPRDLPERSYEALAALFDGAVVTGSRMLDGRASVWTGFRIHDDGFGRLLVRDEGLNERQAGRLTQRLLDLETYRLMAMLAFPLARETRPKVGAAEQRLGDITSRLAEIEGVEDERRLLSELSKLAAESEAMSQATSYRFAASRAYYGLVRKRIEDLREVRIEGLQPVAQFLARRLAPAMETCENVAARQDALSRRVARTSDLLRTRVNVALEEQNRDLLRTMARRARIQLRLQETVEGLSVVAISYYLLSLVSYLAKSLEQAGVPLNPEITVGLAFPLVVAAVWIGVRRLRRAVVSAKKLKD